MNTTPASKPFSQACENNKKPILEVLLRVFKNAKHIVEIGSGTGQHAVYFSQHLPHLVWQPTDRAENIDGIQQWVQHSLNTNLLAATTFDIHDKEWPAPMCDGVFSANTAHIMSWPTAQHMITRTAQQLATGGTFALYGPFNYNGAYTSPSNANFDQWIKTNAPERGIRDFEAVNATAQNSGLTLLEDNAMPANNRLLVWRK